MSITDITDDSLPEGWATAKLPDVAYFAGRIGWRGLKAEEYTESGPMLLSVPNLNQGDIVDFASVDHISRERYAESPEIFVREGDTLLTKDGAGIGKLGFVGHLPREATVNSSLLLLRSLGALHSKFLFYSLKGPRMQSLVKQRITGSTTPHLFQKDIKNFELSVPPLAEQARIVAMVDALLERVNNARRRLDRVPEILKRFRQSVLAAGCSGRLTADWRVLHPNHEPSASYLRRVLGENVFADVPTEDDPVELPEIPESWTWSRCGNICDSDRAITYGVIKLGPPVDGGVPTLRSSDVRWLYIDDSHTKSISEEIAANYSRTFLQGGEVLVTVRGTLGGVAVVPEGMAGYNISREVAMLPVVQHLSPHYVAYSIASLTSQNWLTEVTKGVAYTGVNIRDLKLLPVAIPPIDEQREIVRRVNALMEASDRIMGQHLAGATRTEKIVQAVLAKAFAGELVETEADLAGREGRDYEPASMLLERIASQREQQAKRKPYAGARNGRPSAKSKKAEVR